ncbi:MAG: hypothetical protein ACRDZ7_22525 [Acidimicrobiia bacterium]
MLAGFQFSDGPAEVAAAGAGPPVPAHPRTAAPAPVRSVAVVEAPGPGGPSPWALAGLIPVLVLVASGAYSAWWRRRWAAT